MRWSSRGPIITRGHFPAPRTHSLVAPVAIGTTRSFRYQLVCLLIMCGVAENVAMETDVNKTLRAQLFIICLFFRATKVR